MLEWWREPPTNISRITCGIDKLVYIGTLKSLMYIYLTSLTNHWSSDCHMTSDDSDDEDEDILDDDEPQLDTVMIQHNGAINRIRV